MKLPEHIAISFEKNEHRVCYQSLPDWLDTCSFDDDDWVSMEEKQKALESNTCWLVRWYPHTPVGHCTLLASSFEALVAALEKE